MTPLSLCPLGQVTELNFISQITSLVALRLSHQMLLRTTAYPLPTLTTLDLPKSDYKSSLLSISQLRVFAFPLVRSLISNVAIS